MKTEKKIHHPRMPRVHLPTGLETAKKYLTGASWKKRVVIGAVIVLTAGIIGRTILDKTTADKVTYETAQAEKGTLVSSISGSGTITSGNYTNITTKTSGTVSAVYVTNGDTVTKGQKIALVQLDELATERQTAAWVSYLEATEAVKDTERTKVSADIEMWEARETILNSQEDVDNNVGDTEGEKVINQKELEEARLAFATAELKYKNADADTAAARAKAAAALRIYQENAAAIIAPASGVVSDLGLAEGLVVSASSATSQTSGATIVSAQTIGKINHSEGQLIATVELSELDVVSVEANQKVTMSLDAYPDQTFTGKVLAVNTSGSVSSGVTSYPVTILVDNTDIEIYPNMAVSAQIIIDIKTDVILVPTSAIQDQTDQTSVQVMRDGKPESVAVEVGSANDTQIEIISGVAEGDTVVTATISTENNSDSTSASPFGSFGGSSGRNVRIQSGPPGGGF